MDNEIFKKNKDMFLKTLLNLYLEVSKKDLKKLCVDSGSEMIDDCKIIFPFFDDFYMFDRTAVKIFKIVYQIDSKISEHFAGNNKNNFAFIKKDHLFRKVTNDILDDYSSALVLSYLNTADGASVLEEWITYSELKDGLFYAGTIPNTLKPLCSRYEIDLNGFLKKAETIGGIKSAQYKNAVVINPFNRFPIMFMLYEKDIEFGCEIKVLFSKSANHYLKTDVIKHILAQSVNRLLR